MPKNDFPWMDGQFLNEWLPFKSPPEYAKHEVMPDVQILMAHDDVDGEIRIRVRRLGSHADTNEVEIGISKSGLITTFTHYDT